MKNTHAMLLVVLLSAPFSLVMAAASPDVDDVTMDVVKHSDPSEVTNDIKLPEATETEDHGHDGKAHAKDDTKDDAKDDVNEDAKEHSQESKEHAEDSKDSSQESATQSHDDMK